jgi:hypothetical protein
MCEVLKEFNRQQLEHLVAALEPVEGGCTSIPIFVVHVHDEASMRLRSYAASPGDPSQPPSLCRARHSKIQNNVVDIFAGDTTISWYAELDRLAVRNLRGGVP